MLIRKDSVSLALLALFAAVNHWVLIPDQVIAEGSEDTYPLLLNASLVVLLLCYGLEMFLSHRAGGKRPGVWNITFPELGRILGLLAGIWAWAAALESFGFIPPTALFLLLTALLYGERAPAKLALLALLCPPGLYVVFTLFGSSLPQGVLEHLLSNVLVQ